MEQIFRMFLSQCMIAITITSGTLYVLLVSGSAYTKLEAHITLWYVHAHCPSRKTGPLRLGGLTLLANKGVTCRSVCNFNVGRLYYYRQI